MAEVEARPPALPERRHKSERDDYCEHCDAAPCVFLAAGEESCESWYGRQGFLADDEDDDEDMPGVVVWKSAPKDDEKPDVPSMPGIDPKAMERVMDLETPYGFDNFCEPCKRMFWLKELGQRLPVELKCEYVAKGYVNKEDCYDFYAKQEEKARQTGVKPEKKDPVKAEATVPTTAGPSGNGADRPDGYWRGGGHGGSVASSPAKEPEKKEPEKKTVTTTRSSWSAPMSARYRCVPASGGCGHFFKTESEFTAHVEFGCPTRHDPDTLGLVVPCLCHEGDLEATITPTDAAVRVKNRAAEEKAAAEKAAATKKASPKADEKKA